MPADHRKARDGRYFVLLLTAIVALCLFVPIADAAGLGRRPELLSIFSAVLYAFMLLSAIAVVGEGRVTRILALSLAVPAVAVRLATTLTESAPLLVTQNLVEMAFVGFAAVCLVRFLFVNDRVSMNIIAASICAYFFVAFWFASAFELITIVDPNAFRIPDTTGDQEQRAPDAFTLYYSLVTLTTLGYGDIAPVNQVARMLAAIEAVFGQIYLTVVVARLVGLHIAGASRGEPAKRSDRADD